MVDFDSLQDDGAAQSAPQPQQGQAPAALPNFDDLQSDSDKYGTPSQQLLTGVEGAAQGFAGPAATAAELGLSKLGVPGISAQDIAARAATNPWTHGLSEAGGLAGGLFTGTGEAGLVANIGEHLAPVATTTAGKIGSAALKGFIENGLIQGGDEVSKAMLGQGDPEHPVAAALSHMGAAGLLGAAAGGIFGGIGSKLKQLGDVEAGTTAKNAIADFGNEWKNQQQNPDLLSSVTKELGEFHASTNDAADELRGVTGLKDQAVDALAPAADPARVSEHVDSISRALENAPAALKNDPQFQAAADAWRARTSPQVDPITLQPSFTPANADVFKATDMLKRQLGEWGQFNKKMVPLAEVPFRNAAKSLGSALKSSLEDNKTWGDLGDLQSGVNQAWEKFIPSLKNFNSRMTEDLLGDRVLSPGKVNTYVNQLGKPAAEIKQQTVENFVNAGEQFRDQINNLHAQYGIGRPLEPIPMTQTKSTYGTVTPGAKLAKYLFHTGAPNVTGGLAGKIATTMEGASLGAKEGGLLGGGAGFVAGAMAPLLEGMLREKIAPFARNTVVPGLLRALGSGTTDNLWQLIDHGNNVAKGAQKMNLGIESLFKAGTQQGVNANGSQEDREKLKDFIEKGGVNQQIQQQQNPSPQPIQSPVQAFAEGGAVASMTTPSPLVPSSTEQTPSLFKGTEAIASALPEQNMLLQMARGRVSNYLGSVKPQASMKMPFDREIPNKEGERSYNRALDIANSPLSVLNHVKDGTLTAEHVKHMSSMYPEIYNQLSKKMTERIVKAQLSGEKPTYKTRQAMSLFMNAPLDSTMTPASIQSIQMGYAKNKASAPMQPNAKAQKGSSKLGKLSESLQTNDQARAERANKG